MNPALTGTASRTRTRTSRSRRRQLLAAFARSGHSATAFTRQHGIVYATFCSWRRRPAKPAMAFAEVELVSPPSLEPIVVELG